MPKKFLATANAYRTLVARINRELTDIERFVRQRTAKGILDIGKYIHEHLLKHDERGYIKYFYPRLAKDVNRDISTLKRAVQFYRAYPKVADQRLLAWDHYKRLITIKDPEERKRIEERTIRNKWNTTALGKYLDTKRKLTSNNETPVPRLTFKRGRLNTYQIVPADEPLDQLSPFALDLGFRLQYVPPKNTRVKEGETVELSLKDGEVAGIEKREVSPDELFTYQAYVKKVIDGDTLLTSFYFQGRFLVSQKLRLRGIDCPEMDTDEGKKAKRFVESRLKDCGFVIVKTIKDRTDKFDRYLADVFYSPGEKDSARVAAEGRFLNQELLDNHLAYAYEAREPLL